MSSHKRIASILAMIAIYATAIAAEEDKVSVPATTNTEGKSEASCPLPPMPPAEFCLTQACAARAEQVMQAQLECHKKRMLELKIAAGSPK